MKIISAALVAMAVSVTPALAQTSVSASVANFQPESMAVGPDGSVYLGSQLDARIYRALPGQAVAEPFVDMRPSAFVLGVMADGASSSLWVCEVMSMDRSSPLLKATTALRSFDLASGAPKLRIPLPDATNLCNDFVVGPDRALYVADTTNARILRLRPGASTLETVIQNAALFGVDGLTFLGDVLYVNTVWAGNLYRIPMDAAGKASAPVQIHAPRVLRSPDGMRAHNGKIYLAESANGTVSAITIANDVATFTTLKNGLTGPCAVEPHGNVVWAVERPANRVTAIPLP